MIHRDKKLIFLHIPKTGGTSIKKALRSLGFEFKQSYNKTFAKYGGSHRTPASYDLPKDFKIFSFVRNPYDRLVSEFIWRKEISPRRNYGTDTFEEFVKSIVEPNAHFRHFYKQLDNSLHLNSQYSILSIKGNDIPEVEFIGKFENLEDDFTTYMKSKGFEEIKKLRHLNQGPREKDYKIYYNDYTKEAVTKLYKDDLEHYGYTF
jgi:hypothetical protein